MTTVAAPLAAPTLPRLLSASAHAPGPVSLARHRATYPAPPLVDRRRVAQIVDAVERSGLRGRGGASFPTGRKLRTVASSPVTPIVVVNGSEGEPVSAKDKTLLATNPHLVIDGALLAAAAVGADEVFVGIERDANDALAAVHNALWERADEAAPPIRLVEVPNHYVAGEETALVNLINGGPAKPTRTPPRPFEQGVSGRPTLIDNVETLAHVAQIMRWGPQWFRQYGTHDEPGTALITLSGAVARPGVYEIAIGTSFNRVAEAAGGAPHGVAAVLLGGYYGSWITGPEADGALLSSASLSAFGAGLGCGAVAVLDTGTCGVAETARVLTYLAAETAGQCGPCVHGLAAIAATTRNLAEGRGTAEDVARLHRWAGQIEGRGGCRFPDGAVRLLRSALRVFADDVSGHAGHARCDGSSRRATLPIPDTKDSPWR